MTGRRGGTPRVRPAPALEPAQPIVKTQTNTTVEMPRWMADEAMKHYLRTVLAPGGTVPEPFSKAPNGIGVQWNLDPDCGVDSVTLSYTPVIGTPGDGTDA